MKTYNVIIYQMGKVASSSLVKTLDAFENVNAYQSHFLGEENLKKKVADLLQPDLEEHFIYHGEGQLLRNIGLSRLINRHKMSLEKRELIIISSAREPVDWFRAQLVQEFNGYINDFYQLAAISPNERHLEAAVKIALGRIGEALCGILKDSEAIIGSSAFMSEFWERRAITKHRIGASTNKMLKHILTFFRPFYWFDEHIKRNFKVDIFKYKLEQSWLEQAGNYFTLAIYPYEALHQVKNKIIKLVEREDAMMGELNVSEEKPCAAIIKESIDGWRNYDEIREIYQSKYCQLFGYVN